MKSYGQRNLNCYSFVFDNGTTYVLDTIKRESIRVSHKSITINIAIATIPEDFENVLKNNQCEKVIIQKELRYDIGKDYDIEEIIINPTVSLSYSNSISNYEPIEFHISIVDRS